MRFSRSGIAAAALLGGAAAVVPAVGRTRFERRVHRDVETLFESAALSVGRAEATAAWAALPPPIQRHLQYAIGDAAPDIRAARLRHDGLFRTSPGASWRPIDGREYFTTATPGFVWHARLRAAPGIWIDARDALLHERGHMLVKLLGTIPLADARGSEIDQGATLRWLAEAPWFPYALIAPCVRWTPLDDRTAAATISYEGPPARAVFEVDDDGRIARLRAERYRDLGGGRAALTRWGGDYLDYREFDGFRVPTQVEVGWELDTGWFAYARFHVRAVDYNRTTPF